MGALYACPSYARLTSSGQSERPRPMGGRPPPGNRLEALRGDLRGLHGIRVNDQWRIVFRWTKDGPDDVDVVDYHS